MPRDLVVFVCSGNTCRSPLAEILARRVCGETGWRFASAGLDADRGSPASAGSCDEARDRGLDLDAHRSRRLDGGILGEAAWVVGMTGAHVERIRERIRTSAPEFAGRIGKLGLPGRDLADGADATAGDDVDDPWRKGTELAYTLMAEQVERLVADWCDAAAREES